MTTLKAEMASFEGLVFDTTRGILIRHGSEINLEPKIHQFLALLVSQPNKVIGKESVIDTLWQSKDVNDEALRALIKKTREVLGDNARSPVFIKTIPRSGYIFLPSVSFYSKQEKHKSKIKFLTFSGLMLCVTLLMFYVFVLPIFTDDTIEPAPKTSNLSDRMILDIEGEVSDYFFNGSRIQSLSLNKNTIVYKTLNKVSEYQARYEEEDLQHHGYSLNHQQVYFVRKQNDQSYIDVWQLNSGFTLGPTSSLLIPQDLSGLFAFDSEQGKLYFRHNATDADASNLNAQLYVYDIATKTTDQLQLQTRAFSQSTYLSISPEGNRIFLLDAYPLSTLVQILDMKGTLLVEKKLGFAARHWIWSGDSLSLLFLSDKYKLYTWRIAENLLDIMSEPFWGASQLIGKCGEGCITGIVEDGVQKILQFSEKAGVGSGILLGKKLLDTGLVTSIVRKDSTLIFADIDISQKQTRIQLLNLVSGELSTLKLFEQPVVIESLSINADASMLAGVLNDKIFTLTLNSNLFKFANLPMPKTQYPLFDFTDEGLLYFSSIDPQIGSNVFKFEMEQSVYERISQNMLISFPINQEWQLTLDTQGNLKVYKDESSIIDVKIDSKNSFAFNPLGISFIQKDSPNIIHTLTFEDEKIHTQSMTQEPSAHMLAVDLLHKELMLIQSEVHNRKLKQTAGFTKIF
ncbi:winged helix-turn-helix domain-containing protein [Glaciecola sp. 1036]|uniref:winged helix-turn-helix domain-containing protein n=1 Tax=Alteromonadaceae TaxID=72275 RepID=UPI003CFF5A58